MSIYQQQQHKKHKFSSTKTTENSDTWRPFYVVKYNDLQAIKNGPFWCTLDMHHSEKIAMMYCWQDEG